MPHMWKVTTRNATLRQHQFKTSMAALRVAKEYENLVDCLLFTMLLSENG